jgi:hypothetical protein
MDRAPQVVFDYSGSLDLARQSWRMADQLEQLGRDRGARASAALVGWTGAYADEFVGRVDDEVRTAMAIAGELRAEANGWATEWKKAIDQENYNRYQDACDRARGERSNLDKVVGALFGHDDLPSPPRLADTPASPGFYPTRTVADYSRH